MSLFNGVENFTPAFTGQQIANQTGAGAASAFSSGMNAGTSQKSQGLNQQRFDFQKEQQASMMMKQIEALDAWGNDVLNYLNH